MGLLRHRATEGDSDGRGPSFGGPRDRASCASMPRSTTRVRGGLIVVPSGPLSREAWPP